MSTTPGPIPQQSRTAKLLATEVLLADPETLGDDVLETCLYLLRDRLQATATEND
jgi:hypothetical protein